MGADLSAQCAAGARTLFSPEEWRQWRKHRGEADRLALTGRYHLSQPLESKYSLEQKNLGTGMNGPVRLAKGKAGSVLERRSFAVKALSKKLSTDVDKVKREVLIYLNIDHPNIARLEDVFDTNSTLYLVMECLEGGELFDRIAQGGAYAEGKAVDACREMFEAVAYLHQQKPPIVHRDLKPENFMYDKKGSGRLKLIDFGLSMYRQANHKMSDACGTLGYMAPECLKRQPSYTEKCDIFALGVITYILLTGHPPFLQANRMDEYKPFKQRTFSRLSEGARKFVSLLLDMDEGNRPTAVAAMGDPWMKKNQGLQEDAAIDVDVLRSMQRFCTASQFRRACLSMVAWSLTSEDRRQLEECFVKLDRNKDGRISLSEVKTVLEDNYKINSDDFLELFSRLEGAEHEICYSEFLAAAMQERVRMHEYALAAAFSRFDQRNKGFITKDDLRVMLADSLEGVSAEELLREVDKRGTGKITRQAFLDYLTAPEDDSSDDENAVAPTPVSEPEDTGPRAKRRSSRRELAALVIDGEREREVQETVGPPQSKSFSPPSTRIVGPDPLQRRPGSKARGLETWPPTCSTGSRGR